MGKKEPKKIQPTRNSESDQKEKEMESTLQEINNKLSEILNRMNGIEIKIKSHDEKLNKIEKKMELYTEVKQQQDALIAENRIIKDKLKQVSLKLNDELRKKNSKKIEIVGMPFTNGENLEQMVLETSKICGFPITKTDVKELYRKNQSNKGQGEIIVKLNSRNTRDKLIAGIKKVRLNTSMMGFQGKSTNIYANVPLLPETKQILYQVKMAKEKKGWSSYWIYASEVYIKQETQGKPIKISTMEDLVCLLQ